MNKPYGVADIVKFEPYETLQSTTFWIDNNEGERYESTLKQGEKFTVLRVDEKKGKIYIEAVDTNMYDETWCIELEKFTPEYFGLIGIQMSSQVTDTITDKKGGVGDVL